MATIGSVWASGTWATPAWAAGTWANVVVPVASGPHNRVSISGTAAIYVASPGNVGLGVVVFEVSAAASLSMVPQTQENGSGTVPASCAYYDLLADPRTIIAAGTPITANGVYGVLAPGMAVYLTPSAGSCTINWEALLD